MSLSGSQKGYAFSKLLSVNSTNADSGTTSNFLFNAGTTMQQVLRVSIASVSFYNNFYNIYNDSRGSNNYYTYAYLNAPHTFTLTPGFYSINTILNLMNADLDTFTGIPGQIKWNFNTITNMVYLTIAAGGAINFQLNPPFPNNSLGLLTTLGGGDFLKNTIYNLATGPYTLNAETFPLLGGPVQVYIRSSALSPANSIDAGGSFSNTLLAVAVTAPPLNLNLFECKVDDLCEISYKLPRNLTQIDIQLTDKNGNILDLHGGSLNIELRVWYSVF